MTLVSIPPNPVPDGSSSGILTTPDGISLRYARWNPPPNRKGTVCLFQGRSEFVEKYFETVRDLRARGFSVATIDWRGQGLSQRLIDGDPRKGHIGRFSDYEIDIDTLMREVVLADCPPPYFALGHSMGGLVLIRAAHRGMRWFDRIVLSAPLLGLHGLPFPGALGMLARGLRMIGLGNTYLPRRGAAALAGAPFAGNPLTSDPVRFARNAAVTEAEPGLVLGAPSVAWFDAALRAMAECAEPSYAARIRVPMLLVAAGQDTVVSTPAIERFGARLRTGAHLIVPASRHEILMEQDRVRNQFWAAFDAFIPGYR